MRWPRALRRPRAGPPPAAGADPATLERRRAAMVATQLEARGIRDQELLRAFRTVERHAFVQDEDAYGDRALPVGAGQTISQPYIVALMTAAARPPDGWEGADVLEIGTGSGYQAAILAEMGARVTSVERHSELAEEARRHLDAAGYGERVEIHVAAGTHGWPAGAPYRSILVTAAGPSVPQPLLEQLREDGGRLVMPVGPREHQELTLVERQGSDLHSRVLEPVVFVPLIGRYGVGEG